MGDYEWLFKLADAFMIASVAIVPFAIVDYLRRREREPEQGPGSERVFFRRVGPKTRARRGPAD